MPLMRTLRFVVAAGVLALASRASGESLGEAAAKEQARRHTARRQAGTVAVVHEEELKNATGRIAISGPSTRTKWFVLWHVRSRM